MKVATAITLKSHRARMEDQRVNFNNVIVPSLETYARRKRKTVRINLLEV